MKQKSHVKCQVITRTTLLQHFNSMRSEVPRSTKTHLSVLILNNRDLALNSRLDFICEHNNKHQQRVECVLQAQGGLQGRITTNADDCLPSEQSQQLGKMTTLNCTAVRECIINKYVG